ncbi:MAG TPA: hypothetical protein VFX49_15815 [Chloroflexota bacterium]|nr:hypothetical protein [Chloroflexota bacterium]
MAIARAAVATAQKGVDRRTVFATAAATSVAGVAAAGQAATQIAAQLPAALPAAAPAAVTGGVAAVAAGAALLAGQIVKVTVDVNKSALVGHLHAFLSDPTRPNAPVVHELTKNAQLGLPMPIIEHLLLEGDMSKEDVEAFVDGMLGGRHDVVMH